MPSNHYADLDDSTQPNPAPTTTRRSFLADAAALVAGGALVAAGVLSTPTARAAAKTSRPLHANAPYPEIVVTVKDDKLIATAETVQAGFVLLTVMNHAKRALGIGLLTIPGGNVDSLSHMAATPVPADHFPEIFFTATIAGGPGSVGPGQTAQTVVELGVGPWMIFSEGDQAPLFLTAIETAAGSGTAPEAAVTITEEDFRFVGLDGPLPAGRQTWRVVNAGKQPHMVVVGKIPEGATADQLLRSLASEDAPASASAFATPPAFTSAEVKIMGGVSMQSAGTSVWPIFDLPAGRYGAVCFVPDPGHGGVPHAMEGMISVFDVK